VYRNLDRLSIIDPNSPENDISGGSSNYWVVKESFAKAYDTLQKAMMRSSSEAAPTTSDSIKSTLLGPLLAGKYSHFEIQRRWLDKLAREGLPEYGMPDAGKGAANGAHWDSVDW
jgi:non-canonical poly(A) RNA polymerase PAPD5/7